MSRAVRFPPEPGGTRVSLNMDVEQRDRTLTNGTLIPIPDVQQLVDEGAVVHWPVVIVDTDDVVRLCLVARYGGDIARALGAESYLRAIFDHNLFVDPTQDEGWLLNCSDCIAQRQA